MNNTIRYAPLALTHRAINRWLVSECAETPVRFVPMTMEGDINRWLLEGFSIHENPCRRQFVEERRAHAPSLPESGGAVPGKIGESGFPSRWDLYFPWGNPRVERSGFWMTPTHLHSYAVTWLACRGERRARLALRTCGSLTLWVNGRFVTDFAPFTRNIEASCEVEVELADGLNELAVCFEDLAERDTQYYFRIDYMGDDEVEIVLPVGSASAEEVRSLEAALEQAHFPSDTVRAGSVALHLVNPLNRDIPFRIRSGEAIFGTPKSGEALLRTGDRELVLGPAAEFKSGFNYIELTALLGDVAITRTLGVQIYALPDPTPAETDSIASRKQAALRAIARYGEPDVHKAIALLATGGPAEQAEAWIRQGLAGIGARWDCSDFFLVAVFRLWRDYRNSGLFSEEFWSLVKEVILGFRYWMDEPGDDVMWFFSENHALLFHTCELLAGQLFPDETFTNSGETGSVHRRKAEERLHAWFDRFFAEGLAEWNSSAYLPIDAAGLLHLYDLAESPALREKAGKAMDLIYYYIAVNAHRGVLACTYGRSYEKELKGQYVAGTTSMCWIGYGIGYVNGYSFSNVALCLSAYEPPEEYRQYLLSGGDKGYVFRCEQGAGGYAKLYTYKTPDFVLSSIDDFKPGSKGYQEHVLHLSLNAEANIWVNHPGERAPFGSGRPSYWAGNGYLPKVAQHRGLALALFRIDPSHDADFTHAYFPTFAFDGWTERGGWFFARSGDAYAAVYAAGGLELQSCGPDKGRELRSPGCANAWIVRASHAAESGSFERFIESVLSMEVTAVGGERVVVADPHYGRIELDWNGPLRVNGAERNDGQFGVRGKLEYV